MFLVFYWIFGVENLRSREVEKGGQVIRYPKAVAKGHFGFSHHRDAAWAEWFMRHVTVVVVERLRRRVKMQTSKRWEIVLLLDAAESAAAVSARGSVEVRGPCRSRSVPVEVCARTMHGRAVSVVQYAVFSV